MTLSDELTSIANDATSPRTAARVRLAALAARRLEALLDGMIAAPVPVHFPPWSRIPAAHPRDGDGA